MPAANSPLPDWQRAFGEPVFQGLIKQTPADFQVVEVLGFTPSGDGEHDFLWVEKTSANTVWVARSLARYAGVADRDVGYAGLKDRHALTRQWFSVRRPSGGGTDWRGYEQSGVRILETSRNQRKLKRGANRANHFRIAIAGAITAQEAITERLERIRASGVPNYFAEQRFGRNGGNMQLVNELFSGKRLKRDKRSIALSSARSYLFNEILQARIVDDNWTQSLPGEMLNLDGTGSVFAPGAIDDEVKSRLANLDVHPTGALWGSGDPPGRAEAVEYDRNVAARMPELAAGLEKFGLNQARRALRLNVRDLSWEFIVDGLLLEFELTSGAYATAVIRELARYN
jgi:tRNA pseudouridine13 synthase